MIGILAEHYKIQERPPCARKQQGLNAHKNIGIKCAENWERTKASSQPDTVFLCTGMP
jgi:hypothetical protein